MDKLKSTASEASTLEWGKRMTGFISCSVVAAVCLILGVYMLCVPLIGPTLFTVFYTIGNTCGVCSTMFLMEPEKQLTLMFDETRVHATAAVIACLVLTLCAAFWVKSAGLALLFCILQVLSFIW
uniref:Vesicle transport protein n=2 Tax=Sparus aurata TaxID=8175 RepID=A0A671W9U1_SPAAU